MSRMADASTMFLTCAHVSPWRGLNAGDDAECQS